MLCLGISSKRSRDVHNKTCIKITVKLKKKKVIYARECMLVLLCVCVYDSCILVWMYARNNNYTRNTRVCVLGWWRDVGRAWSADKIPCARSSPVYDRTLFYFVTITLNTVVFGSRRRLAKNNVTETVPLCFLTLRSPRGHAKVVMNHKPFGRVELGQSAVARTNFIPGMYL